MIKDPVKNRKYKRNWMRKRRKDFLKDKHCVVCGSQDRLIIGWGTMAKRKYNFSMSQEKLERMMREYNHPIYCYNHWLEKLREKRMPVLIHGTFSAYRTHKCKCVLCMHVAARRRKQGRNSLLRKRALPLYQQGMKVSEIAKELGAKYDRVRYAVKKEQILERTKKYYLTDSGRKIKKQMDYNAYYKRSPKYRLLLRARISEKRRVDSLKKKREKDAKKEKLLAAAKRIGLI